MAELPAKRPKAAGAMAELPAKRPKAAGAAALQPTIQALLEDAPSSAAAGSASIASASGEAMPLKTCKRGDSLAALQRAGMKTLHARLKAKSMELSVCTS